MWAWGAPSPSWLLCALQCHDAGGALLATATQNVPALMWLLRPIVGWFFLMITIKAGEHSAAAPFAQ